MELMVVVAIVSILAIYAYPNYMAHVLKTRRVEAQGILVQDASYLERLYTEIGCYNPKSDKTCGSASDAVQLCPPQTGTPAPPRLPNCQSPSIGASTSIDQPSGIQLAALSVPGV